MKIKTLLLLLCAVAIGATSCDTTKKAQKTNDDEMNIKIESKNDMSKSEMATNVGAVDDASLPLSAYLKRVGGVQVTGQEGNVTVRIRGASLSVGDNPEPLFIINGMQVGRGYESAVDVVNTEDIKDIKVLRDVGSTAIYGVQGSAGVILITTKKG